MSNQERNSNKFMLIAGVALGAAVTYILTSPKGKEWTEKAIEKGMDLADKAKAKGEVLVDQAKVHVGEAIENASAKIDDVKVAATNSSVGVLDAAESKVNSFQEGISRAKESLKNTSRN